MNNIISEIDEAVAITELVPYPGNPNKGNLASLAESIDANGFYAPLIVQRSTRRILAGNHRHEYAVQHGVATLPVVWVDVDDATAERILVADNRIARQGEFDPVLLAELLESVKTEGGSTVGTGFDKEAFDEILKQASNAIGGPLVEEEPPPIDHAEELLEKWRVERGQIFQIGKHRLMCGDSTSEADVTALMEGQKADMVFTDPPYNQAENRDMTEAAALRPNSYGALKDAVWDRDFSFSKAGATVLPFLADACTVYVCMSEFIAPEVWAWMKGWSDYFSYCVWCKPNPMPSLAKAHWTWATELIGYATRGKRSFNFPETGHALNWWEIQVEQSNRTHPTQKPVAIPEHAITHSSRIGSIVLDLFGGSGSTLVACNTQGRTARLMEISPAYCAVILERMSKLGIHGKLAEVTPQIAPAETPAIKPRTAKKKPSKRTRKSKR